MKKRSFLAILLALMLLCGCQTAQPVQTTTMPTEPPRAAFTGDFDSYVPQHTGRWEKAWEEDILFFAQKYLTEHSYLSDSNFFIQYQPDLSGNVEYDFNNSAFDPQKRQAFVEAVDALLTELPELSDEQITCRLIAMVAALGDVHSNVYWGMDSFLPLFYQPFFREDGVEYRVVTVPSGKEKWMLAKLVSYNGIPVEEVVERLSVYVSHESDRALPFQLTGAFVTTALNCRDYLLAAGIIDGDDQNIKVCLETENGIIEERISFQTQGEILLKGLTTHPMETEENLRNRNRDYYWWTMVDDTTLYMQLTTMVDWMPDYTIDNLFSEVRTAIRDSEQPLKVILDFRGNGGGYVHESTLNGFVRATEWYEHDGVYILIDGNCFSAGVMAPYYLHQAVERAVLVGAPTGQGLIFPANSAQYELPNNGVVFTIGDEITCVDREWVGDALEPDVLVYQTLEDYENMVDSVLNWALAD